ncbi:hypothetical protein TNCV_4415111 [Trichonephila clavipes]|uniref:Uncharacterized protein n=1 Tax=Trichonephila clavipes TaxID=2585209 RepID=A0A8X6S433_TRICX|nr:hypothetical protein TNCV_4415111 [Trichonephila clavipes]
MDGKQCPPFFRAPPPHRFSGTHSPFHTPPALVSVCRLQTQLGSHQASMIVWFCSKRSPQMAKVKTPHRERVLAVADWLWIRTRGFEP